MNHAPSRKRLLFNPLFRAVWIGMIAASLATWLCVDAAATALPAATPTALLIASAKTLTSLPMCLLALLSIVVSLYGQRHGHHQFAFQKMGSGAFAVSILTFLGFAGPWFMLGTAVILGLCAALTVLSLQPVLLDLLGKAGLTTSLASGALGPHLGQHLGRTAGNLASGILATALGPAAIAILSALSLCAVFIAGRTSSLRADRAALTAAG